MHGNYLWWWGEDSNLRRLRRQIYSLFPLATREPHLYVNINSTYVNINSTPQTAPGEKVKVPSIPRYPRPLPRKPVL